MIQFYDIVEVSTYLGIPKKAYAPNDRYMFGHDFSACLYDYVIFGPKPTVIVRKDFVEGLFNGKYGIR